MHEFHINGKLVKGINSSFITLIPKKDSPTDLVDYRPISLVGSVYKILAKVLSKRMNKVLPRLVSEVQTTFIGGRCTPDGVLIANEVIEWWKSTKQKGVILKLDFKKAYDSFLDDTIIFCEADRNELLLIQRILRCFEVMSGLKINFHKSVVCEVSISDSEVKAFTVPIIRGNLDDYLRWELDPSGSPEEIEFLHYHEHPLIPLRLMTLFSKEKNNEDEEEEEIF
ncbi:uncharacterized protein LOC114315319 [Camellia sinensis]|uniref:uncharacterized protein LOC114315319 n=1 Tax=Camellia sinensis TaxID=4442 RepID=UPI00103615AC|nr:uncharacterized protein LOC114315319 [Camellia sinensis]